MPVLGIKHGQRIRQRDAHNAAIAGQFRNRILRPVGVASQHRVGVAHGQDDEPVGVQVLFRHSLDLFRSNGTNALAIFLPVIFGQPGIVIVGELTRLSCSR